MKKIGQTYGIGAASKNRVNPLGHVERRRGAPQSKHLGLVSQPAEGTRPRSLDRLGMTAAFFLNPDL